MSTEQAVLSPNARIAYDRLKAQATKTNQPFIIADKPNGSMYLFNKQGVLVNHFPALFGKNTGDFKPGPDTNITEAGVFQLGKPYQSAKLGGKAYVIANGVDKALRIHSVWLKNPEERRLARLASPTPNDNRISQGCINLAAEDMQAFNRFMHSGRALLGILPDNQSQLDRYIPPDTAR